ncbi:MAG TPA: hypothetical protein VHO70_13920 [Chitinispirillaceae bacterium]|nr:hypothetical protein [Chitinispirillaceae bacterium]
MGFSRFPVRRRVTSNDHYSLFQFELWLSAVNRKRRDEVLKLISQSKWRKYQTVENNGNADAIIEIKIKGNDDFSNMNTIVTKITNETIPVNS